MRAQLREQLEKRMAEAAPPAEAQQTRNQLAFDRESGSFSCPEHDRTQFGCANCLAALEQNAQVHKAGARKRP